jgi:phosphate transport system protein
MLGGNRTHYLQMLEELSTNLLELYSRVSKSFGLATEAFHTGNLVLCDQIVQNNKAIISYRHYLDSEVLKLLALQQPVVARDLRFVTSIYLFTAELERIGDYSKVIAKITGDLYSGDELSPVERSLINQLSQMANFALNLLDGAIDSFVKGDVDSARIVAKEDDILDADFASISAQILTGIINNQVQQEKALLLSRVAHNIERVGDRAVNICERVVFVQIGELADF